MRMTAAIFATLLMLSVGSVTQAEDHPLGTIKGNQIDLKVYDHALAGSMKDFVMWGFVDEATFSSELVMRKDGQIVKAKFGKLETGKFGGTVAHDVEGKSILTSVEFDHMDKTTQAIVLKINGELVEVKITSPAFEDGHFINPTFSTVYQGQPISFTMEGKSCWGYSLHLAFVILGAYLH